MFLKVCLKKCMETLALQNCVETLALVPARVPTQFLVSPKSHACFYNSIDTQKMFSNS